MMKTTAGVLISVLLLFLFLPAAPAADLPDVDEVLSNYRHNGTGNRVRVVNCLDDYSIYNEGTLDFDNTRILIFERRDPEKAFTESEVSCDDPGYEPQDLGETRLYLRLDMMDLLPSSLCASSLACADLIIIAENIYALESQVIHTEYENSGAGDLPDFLESPEELAAYLAEHPPVIKSRTYKPLFTAYSIVSLFSTGNKAVSPLDFISDTYSLECNNPEASALWDSISPLSLIITMLRTGNSVSEDVIFDSLEGLQSVSEEEVDLWKDLVWEGKYAQAADAVEEYFWTAAGDLAACDPDDEAAEWYPKIIEARDLAALEAFVSFRNYTGIDTPDDVIISEKLYIGQNDPDWLDSALADTISALTGE